MIKPKLKSPNLAQVRSITIPRRSINIRSKGQGHGVTKCTTAIEWPACVLLFVIRLPRCMMYAFYLCYCNFFINACMQTVLFTDGIHPTKSRRSNLVCKPSSVVANTLMSSANRMPLTALPWTVRTGNAIFCFCTFHRFHDHF